MTFPPLFPLALCSIGSFHTSGTFRAVFPPVRFRQEIPAALAAAFQLCPVQEGGFQLPVKGKYGSYEPAAEERIADALHTYARLAVFQRDTVAVVIVAALMQKTARRAMLLVIHVWAFTVHYPAPFRAPARV